MELKARQLPGTAGMMLRLKHGTKARYIPAIPGLYHGAGLTNDCCIAISLLFVCLQLVLLVNLGISEPRHDKTNKVTVRPENTQISAQSDQSSLSA